MSLDEGECNLHHPMWMKKKRAIKSSLFGEPVSLKQEPFSLVFGEYKNPNAYHFCLIFKQEANSLGLRKIQRGAPPAILLSASTNQPPNLQNLSQELCIFMVTDPFSQDRSKWVKETYHQIKFWTLKECHSFRIIIIWEWMANRFLTCFHKNHDVVWIWKSLQTIL